MQNPQPLQDAEATGPFGDSGLGRWRGAAEWSADGATGLHRRLTHPAYARVNAAAIPDGRALPPDQRLPIPVPPPLAPGIHPLPLAGDDGAIRPFALRPAPSQSGLRLIPAEGFAWGHGTTSARPRTRGDHVLIWITRGGAALDWPRRRQPLAAGSVSYIPTGTAFAFRPLGRAAGHVLLIAPHLAQRLDPALPAGATTGAIGDAAPLLHATLQGLADEIGNPGSGSTAAIQLHLGLLAVRLARLTPQADAARQRPAAIPDLPLIDRFLTLAEAELGKGRTISDLAAMLDTSAAALDHACQTAHGKRAIQMIHDLRFDRALAALRRGDRAPADIARDLGYASQAHLTRAFVDRTGRLPDAFRAR